MSARATAATRARLGALALHPPILRPLVEGLTPDVAAGRWAVYTIDTTGRYRKTTAHMPLGPAVKALRSALNLHVVALHDHCTTLFGDDA